MRDGRFFENVYLRRVNRYGDTTQERIMNQAKQDFENVLLNSIYRVNVKYNNKVIPALLEPKHQTNSEVIQKLCTRLDDEIPSGTIVYIKNKEGQKPEKWMVYYEEKSEGKHYNRYIVLKMNRLIRWRGRDEEIHYSYCYFFGKTDSVLKDTIEGGRGDTAKALYLEDENNFFAIMPFSPYLKKDCYFEIDVQGEIEAFRVLGYDSLSTEGVEFVTLDHTYEYDKTPLPVRPPEDIDDAAWFWLENGGKDINGNS